MKYYWPSREHGPIEIKDMDTDHLQNSANYINKRIMEWEELRKEYPEDNLGPLIIKERKATAWRTAMIRELCKRRKKQLKRIKELTEE